MRKLFIFPAVIFLALSGFAKEKPQNPQQITVHAAPGDIVAQMLADFAPAGYTVQQQTANQLVIARPLSQMEALPVMVALGPTSTCQRVHALTLIPEGDGTRLMLGWEIVCRNGFGAENLRDRDLSKRQAEWLQKYLQELKAKAEKAR